MVKQTEWLASFRVPRQLIACLSAAVLALSVAGCGDKDESTATAPEETTSETMPHDTINASPATPDIPPASDARDPVATDSSSAAPSTEEAAPLGTSTEPTAEEASDTPKVIDKPAEATPDDQGPKPKSENSDESP